MAELRLRGPGEFVGLWEWHARNWVWYLDPDLTFAGLEHVRLFHCERPLCFHLPSRPVDSVWGHYMKFDMECFFLWIEFWAQPRCQTLNFSYVWPVSWTRRKCETSRIYIRSSTVSEGADILSGQFSPRAYVIYSPTETSAAVRLKAADKCKYLNFNTLEMKNNLEVM
jgi:hypothetical protein